MKPTDLPSDLAASLSTAEKLLKIHDENVVLLRATSTTLPQLLSELSTVRLRLGAVQLESNNEAIRALENRLAELELRRAAVARTRGALVSRLLDGQAALEGVRAAIHDAKSEYVTGLIRDFEMRHAAALTSFRRSLAEGIILAEALRVEVPMALPCRLVQKNQGDLMPRPFGFGDPPPAARIEYDLDGVQAQLSPEVAHVIEMLSDLDRAIEFCRGIRSHQRDVAMFGATRSAAPAGFDPASVYAVIRSGAVVDILTGTAFEAGTLLDSSIIPPALLMRSFKSKCVSLAA